MPDLSQWFLTNILSPLLLPLFILMILCMIADVKPEPIVQAFISLFGTLVTGFFKLLAVVFGALLRAVTPQRTYPPSRRPPSKYPPRS